MVATHNAGISAVQLQPQLGIRCRETAWMMLHKLRRAMIALEREPLKHEIEVDESYLKPVTGMREPGCPGLRKANTQTA